MAPYFSIFLDIEIWDYGESNDAYVGVLIIFAPNPLKTLAFSADIFYGIVMTQSYPFTAQAKASPIPVFPDVASTIVDPGFSLPVFSASKTILFPIRS